MKHLLMLIFLAALGHAAQAENWVEITSSPDGGVKQFLDIDSIERNSGSVEMWRVFDYKAPYLRQVNRKPYSSQRVHTEFDCPGRAMRQVYFAWHAEPMGKGELLYQSEYPEIWEIDSFDEFTKPLWKIACAEFDR